MIDLHSHILPNVDDGSSNIKETLEILYYMETKGVKTAAATPHYPLYNTSNFKEKIKTKINEIKKEILNNDLELNIVSGAEIMYTERLPKLYYEDKLLTLNNTDYLLLEFRMGEEPKRLEEVVHDLKSMGLKIIIAHPERYFYIQKDYTILYKWIEEYNLKLMLNSSSLNGSHGSKAEKTAQKMLELGLCHLMASDTHGRDNRPFTLDQGLQKAEEIRFGSRNFFNKNAEAVLENKELNNLEIKREKPSLLKNVFSFLI